MKHGFIVLRAPEECVPLGDVASSRARYEFEEYDRVTGVMACASER
jgi:hypothetical protein